MCKEKNVAVLEHQLMEVEVRVSAWQSPGQWGGGGGPGCGSPVKCICLSAPTGDSASVPGGSGGAAGQDASVPGCTGGLLGP